jgi:protein-tyrosine phosphatase
MLFVRRPQTSVLLVCSANICRSPMAEGLLRRELQQLGLQKQVKVDSAGTHASQTGRAPDPRARLVCQQHGIEIGQCRARQVGQRDFERFDHILAMDANNHEWLSQACPEEYRRKIAAIGCRLQGSDRLYIPDPYYGNQQGFREVFILLGAAVQAFAAEEFAR